MARNSDTAVRTLERSRIHQFNGCYEVTVITERTDIQMQTGPRSVGATECVHTRAGNHTGPMITLVREIEV
jgi:hypothetical protein